MWKLFKDQSGAAAIYAAFIGTMIIGAGVLALDFGKATVLKSQMQNAAGAAATTAAIQLDGRSGARQRATNVAQSSLTNGSAIADAGGSFGISAVRFYSSYDPSTHSGVAATGDADAAYVEVVMSLEEVTAVLQPVLEMISSATAGGNIMNVGAFAVATPAHLGCGVTPLFVCNPNEPGAPGAVLANDILDPANTNQGKQFVVKAGAGNLNTGAPGNFGLLCPNDGTCGAPAVRDALAGADPDNCGDGNVTTKPGVTLNQVRRGLNVRFDQHPKNEAGMGPPGPAARNGMGQGRDSDIDDVLNGISVMGNGNWDPVAYWTANHVEAGICTDVQPVDLANYTRFQVYLYESGITFWRSGPRTNTAHQTVNSGDPPALPPTGVPWTLVDPIAEWMSCGTSA